MRTVIVGGGACGASCAARLRRLDENAQIIILEATDEISIANCGLPYYCSDVIDDRENMIVAKPTIFSDLLNIEVRLNSKVTSIDNNSKKVVVNNEYELSYDNLVLALGASPLKPPIEGINNNNVFTVRTLNDADKIKAFVKYTKAQNALVIGGGFIGVEMAENLIELGLNTTLVELAPQILLNIDSDMVCFAQNELREKGCHLIFNDGVKAIREKEVELQSGKSIEADVIILAIGIKPDTELAKNCGIELGIKNTIKVNEYMQTSVSDIWAGGDSVQVKDFVTNEPAFIPMAGPANRQGRIIADNIYALANNRKLSSYKNSQGTAVIKVFDKTIASVGKNERQLKQTNIKYLKNIIQSNSHAGYYPGATPIVIKLLFNEEGKILGAQAAGFEGVEKRIDVISSVMRLGGGVQELIDSELCYAPPYSSAKDPVNMIGMSSQNILDGLFKPAFYEDLKDAVLIDVRPKNTYDEGTIEGAVSIPVTEIRKRYNEVPRDKKVVVFCRRGFTSYVACRILQQLGFDNVQSFCGGKNFYNVLAEDKKQQAVEITLV